MAKTFKIDDDVRDVLCQAAIDGTSVKLTGQLERKLYERVNKVLVGAGGKWNRKAGAHLFESDPRKILGLAIENGVGTNVQQVTQLFPTPPDIARQVVALAEIEPGEGYRVLEPSAGTGALIAAIRKVNALCPITAVEINVALAASLESRYAGSVRTVCADFLDVTPAELQGFDRIVANPPFANGADIKHVRHALTFLKPGGRLVSIVANGPRQREALEPLATAWIDLPAGSFAEQGTNVNTAIVVIDV